MKADPKAKGAAAAAAEAAPAPKKKMLILIIAALVMCAATGGIVFFLTKSNAPPANAQHAAPATHPSGKVEPPVFVPIEPFTVNLQPEAGDQYLQTTLTLQVGGQTQVDVIKANMPLVRSRLLLLLSSKKASEINTAEGKKKLSEEIVEQVNQPFIEKGPQQNVLGVYFTSFIIQ
ncbi:flagellar basal body-associated protein FliL [Massilia sp. W12]|uniref:flagellar basal body-associated protein FliL n=1 Tax=Massilia sp. W12 TaxID=3126507 RepID=UPI0030D382F9